MKKIIITALKTITTLLKEEKKNFPVNYYQFTKNLLRVKPVDENLGELNFWAQVAYANASVWGSEKLRDYVEVVMKESREMLEEIKEETTTTPEETSTTTEDDYNWVSPKESILWFMNHEFYYKMGRCFICKRELTNPDSIRNGVGPICAEKYGTMENDGNAFRGLVKYPAALFAVASEPNPTGKSIAIKNLATGEINHRVSIKNVVVYGDDLCVYPYYDKYFRSLVYKS